MYVFTGIVRALVPSTRPEGTAPGVLPSEDLAPLSSLRHPGTWRLWSNPRTVQPVIDSQKSTHLAARAEVALRHH